MYMVHSLLTPYSSALYGDLHTHHSPNMVQRFSNVFLEACFPRFTTVAERSLREY